jgi:hypothetical protein
MGRWRDGVAFFDQRVEIDHLLVVMKEVNNDLPRYVRRQRANRCKLRALEHLECRVGNRQQDNREMRGRGRDLDELLS